MRLACLRPGRDYARRVARRGGKPCPRRSQLAGLLGLRPGATVFLVLFDEKVGRTSESREELARRADRVRPRGISFPRACHHSHARPRDCRDCDVECVAPRAGGSNVSSRKSVRQRGRDVRSATDLDIAVIASPNRTHIPLAVDALAAGLHVVVDKPFAASVSDAVRAIDAARERKKLLTVYQNRRWDGDFLTVRQLVAAGRLGRVLRSVALQSLAAGSSGQLAAARGARRRRRPALRHRYTPHRPGARALRSRDNVDAELDRRRPGVNVDDDSFVALTHASGVRSHLWMSALEAQPGPRFRVLGDQGAYVKFGMDVQEERLRNGDNPSAPDWEMSRRTVGAALGRTGRANPSGPNVETTPSSIACSLRRWTRVVPHRSIPGTRSRRSRSSKPLSARTHVDKSCACSQFEHAPRVLLVSPERLSL